MDFKQLEQTKKARAYTEALYPLIERAYMALGERFPLKKPAFWQRNSLHARQLADADVPVDRVVAAWKAACDRMGEPVYSLKIVQDQLLKIAPSLRRPAVSSGIREYTGDEELA